MIAALRPNFALIVTGRALQGFAAALIPVGITETASANGVDGVRPPPPG